MPENQLKLGPGTLDCSTIVWLDDHGRKHILNEIACSLVDRVVIDASFTRCIAKEIAAIINADHSFVDEVVNK